jgi:ketosteroid isomerase-like protein
MKTKSIITLLLVMVIIFAGCKENDEITGVENGNNDIVTDNFPKAQSEIQEVLDGIFKSIQDKDADKLISYHVYGPKFTEFRDSAPRFGSAGNEEYERGFVAAISSFEYDLNDLKIDVFGDVAVVTFHADFRPVIEGNSIQIHGGVTLIFVKTVNGWKITHEHFSPLNI